MNTGIESKHLKKIRDIFQKYPQIQKAILFGSRSKGNAREGSDIDVALKGKEIDSRVLTQIGIDYDALYLPWKLDIIAYDTIENPDLRAHIDRVGIPF